MQIVVGNVVGLEGVEPSIVLSGLSGAHLPILLQDRWCPRQDLNLHALRLRRDLSRVVGYRYPTLPNWHRWDDLNAVRLVWKQAAVPGAHRCKQNGGRWRNRTPEFNLTVVFRTICRPFSGTFHVKDQEVVGGERLELSRTRHQFLRLAWLPITPPAHGAPYRSRTDQTGVAIQRLADWLTVQN